MPVNNLELAAAVKNIAENHKTLYVMGCFGAPMTAANKKRYTNNHSYNKKSSRTKLINAASSDTFGFDCVCLIKGVLWGWCGDRSKTYGGAYYASNGVPDIGADSMIKVCSKVSTDFTQIEVGELVWMKGHVGIYIGGGLAVECTPSWENKVQITACNRSVSGYKRRNWAKHGRLPYVEYVSEPAASEPCVTVIEWQSAAIADGFRFPKYGADGEWGAECESVAKSAVCKRRLLSYKYNSLTKTVQRAVGLKDAAIDGKFGKDTEREVKRWQKSEGLTADGIVGINTWKKLLGV